MRLNFSLFPTLLVVLSGCATGGGVQEQHALAPVESASESSSELNREIAVENTQSEIERKVHRSWSMHKTDATADYHFTLGQSYSLEGKTDLAIEEYKAALTYDDQSSLLHTKLAAEYAKKGILSLSLDHGRQAIHLDPKNLDAWILLGTVYNVGKEPDHAVEAYKKVLAIDPTHEEAIVLLVQIHIEADQLQEAAKAIQKFNSQNPESAPAWYMAGMVYQLTEQNNSAVTAYKKALLYRPGFPQAALSLGFIYETLNQPEKALSVYRDSFDAQEDTQVGNRLAHIYIQKNLLKEATSVLDSLRYLDPDDLNVPIRLGLIQLQLEKWDLAVGYFEQVLQKVPDSDRVNYYISGALEQLQQIPEAIQHLKQVSSDSKYFQDAVMHAMYLMNKTDQKDKVATYLQETIKKSPEYPKLHLALASMHEADGQNVIALSVINSAEKIFPEDEQILYYKGAILEKIGAVDAALAVMEKIIVNNPDHPEALNFIAYNWTKQGIRLRDAEVMLRKALKLKPDSAYIMDSLGWNLFLTGRKKEALPILEKAATLKTEEIEILEHLAEVYASHELDLRAASVKQKIKQITEAKNNIQTDTNNTRMPASVK